MNEQKMKDLITKLLNGLTDEQKEKVKACKSLNELITCLGEWARPFRTGCWTPSPGLDYSAS